MKLLWDVLAASGLVLLAVALWCCDWRLGTGAVGLSLLAAGVAGAWKGSR